MEIFTIFALIGFEGLLYIFFFFFFFFFYIFIYLLFIYFFFLFCFLFMEFGSLIWLLWQLEFP